LKKGPECFEELSITDFFQQYQTNSARREIVEGTPNTFFNKLSAANRRLVAMQFSWAGDAAAEKADEPRARSCGAVFVRRLAC
jgi:hypothetical protein